MKFNSTRFQNIILAFGMMCILIGTYFLVGFSAKSAIGFWGFLRFLCLSGFGMVLIFLALVLTDNYFYIFFGLNLFVFGILALIIDKNIFPYSLSELWPVIVMSCGVSLLPAGLYKVRRIKAVYLIPALVLIVSGAVFLLFSFDIIEISFKKFLLISWPFLCLLLGFILVVIFIVQQFTKKHFPYMTDDYEDSIVIGVDD